MPASPAEQGAARAEVQGAARNAAPAAGPAGAPGAGGTAPVELHHLDGAAARVRMPLWLPLYRACFGPPPWSDTIATLDQYEGRIGWQFDQLGYRAVEARAAGGRVIGVAYGWPAADTVPDRQHYRLLTEAFGATLERLWRSRPFEIVELMVDPAARRQGLGQRLLDELRPADAACWLVTHTGSDATAFYERLGWHQTAAGSTAAGVPLTCYTAQPLGSVSDPDPGRGSG